MKRLLLTLFAAAAVHSYADAQQMDEASMKAWQDYMTPGPAHARLARAAGSWTVETKMFWDPSQPMQSAGTATVTMELGGRYQISRYKGMMMGMPFEGMSMVGYDNKTREYTNIWIDNMGTGTMTLTGRWDEATRSITYTGTMVEPTSGAPVAVREVVSFPDDNQELMVMYQTMNGAEVKVMEMKSVRTKTGKKS